ncbi:hypothetical protein ACQ27_gp086 [Klebsiella phage K64-1]|nr:hypothetical protein ACQ27_gp086 [Klebsiella phage K64-1]
MVEYQNACTYHAVPYDLHIKWYQYWHHL